MRRLGEWPVVRAAGRDADRNQSLAARSARSGPAIDALFLLRSPPVEPSLPGVELARRSSG